MNTPLSHPNSDRQARFERIFRERYDSVRRHAVRCGSSDPDDVASECFTAMWRRLDEVRPDLERAWLIAATRKITANQRRGDVRRTALRDAIAAQPQTPLGIDIPELDPAIATALGDLSPTDRQVLTLSVWDELSPKEIAFVLGLSRSAASVRLHRARTRFRERYASASPHPTPTSANLIGGIDA
jgi:RNA polymerase sigma-70 factor (ECF subfamily)